MKSAPTESERGPIYLDSSAILKLVFIEDESDALDAFLRGWPRRTTSSLARVEVMRMAMRVEDAAVTATAREVLGEIDFATEGLIADKPSVLAGQRVGDAGRHPGGAPSR